MIWPTGGAPVSATAAGVLDLDPDGHGFGLGGAHSSEQLVLTTMRIGADRCGGGTGCSACRLPVGSGHSMADARVARSQMRTFAAAG